MSKRPKGIVWSAVDWSQASPDLALRLGVHIATVCRMRLKLAPETRSKKNRGKGVRFDLQRWINADWRQSSSEIAESLGVPVRAVQAARKRLAPATLHRSRSRVDWGLIDWTTSDVVIARQVGVTRGAVAYQRQKRAKV